MHWTNGGLFDLVKISTRCREIGARLVIDASQSLGALALDFNVVKPDFLVAVGYKWLLGPYGLGYLYVAEEQREGSEDFSRLVNYVEQYRAGARRFDVGEKSALELNQGGCAALQQLCEWGVSTVAQTLAPITRKIEQRARELGLAVSDATRGPHMLGLELPQGARNASSVLSAANVFVGARGNSLRIAPHMYTTESDLERLFTALGKLARQG